MKHLMLMRHAKSSWKEAGLPDHDRPLNQRGRKAAPRMGQWCQQQDCWPNLIVTSTATRAQKTAELFVEQTAGTTPIQADPRLYRADSEALEEVIRETPADIHRLMLVGHNPEMQQLLGQMTGQEHAFPTAAIAHFTLGIDDWFEFRIHGDASLLDLWKPKELPDE